MVTEQCVCTGFNPASYQKKLCTDRRFEWFPPTTIYMQIMQLITMQNMMLSKRKKQLRYGCSTALISRVWLKRKLMMPGYIEIAWSTGVELRLLNKPSHETRLVCSHDKPLTTATLISLCLSLLKKPRANIPFSRRKESVSPSSQKVIIHYF